MRLPLICDRDLIHARHCVCLLCNTSSLYRHERLTLQVQFDADGPPRRKRPLDRRLSLAMTTDLDADADDIRGNHEPDEAHESFISASRYGGISATEPSVDDEPSISVAPLITYVLFSNVFTLLFLQYMVTGGACRIIHRPSYQGEDNDCRAC